MPRGVLVIRVKEASGKNKSESVVWDPNFIEGFVRAELRTPDGKKTNVRLEASHPPAVRSENPRVVTICGVYLDAMSLLLRSPASCRCNQFLGGS